MGYKYSLFPWPCIDAIVLPVFKDTVDRHPPALTIMMAPTTIEAKGVPYSIPGTVHLVDLDHMLHTRHANGGDIVLVPTPSYDPDDPLNWLPRKKILSSICANL
jgi:hypothetical protein